MCLRYARNRSDAQDMLQDGFLAIFESIESFKFQGSFEGWLKRIVMRQIIATIRKNYQSKQDWEIEIIEINQPEALQNLHKEDILKIVHSIPEKYRIVFNLIAVENYSHKEVADFLNIEETTSRSIYHRSRKMLKERLNRIDTFEKKIINYG